MSSTSGASSTTATSGTLGNIPPVTFPGVSSGIDYNSIIEKYTADTMLQEQPAKTQINQLNLQNTAILKITNLIGALQDSLTTLSNPDTFNAYTPTVSNTASGSPAATATQISGETPVSGTYTINAQTAATATTIFNNPNANGALDGTQPLADEGTSIAATNGSNPAGGILTVNGVEFHYNVLTQTLTQIITNLNAVLQASDGGGATLNADGTVTLQGVTSLGSGADSGNLEQVLKLDTAQITPVTLNPDVPLGNESLATTPVSGSIIVNGTQINYDPSTDTLTSLLNQITAVTGGTASISGNEITLNGGVVSLADGPTGNLLEALNLNGAISGGSTTSTAPVTANDQVTSSSTIGGISGTSTLDQNNNSGFATPVTAGTFTINGVQFTVDPTTQSLSDIISEINGSSAGVTATYNPSTSQITLTSTTPGPQGILLGAGADTSNFLTATGLKTGSTVAGTQASLTYTDALGQHTVYSATNDFDTVIPGVDLTVTNSSPATLPAGSTFYTVTVAPDPTQAETAINAFITAYNAVITELNKDTVAPTVTAGSDATTGTSQSSSTGGGVLYGNFQISNLRDQLVQLVSGFIPSGSSAYNSLQSVGIDLTTASQTVGAQSDSDDSTSTTDSDTSGTANNSFNVTTSSGLLAALDTTTFEAAYAANSIALQNLFTLAPKLSGSQAGAQPLPGSNYGFSYLLGSALANTDGLATFLTGSVVTPTNLGSVLLTSLTDSNNQQIDSLQQQIALINQEATDQADQLRQQFSASESQIAELQALQGQIAAIGH